MMESVAVSFDEGARLRAGAAVSWGAIFAGAVVAIATSLILLALGSGLGFASMSPWPGQGVSASTFAIASAIWLLVTQWLSAAIGGYLAGRLRHRWLATHVHEVFFRDTAHGLVTWAVATTVVAVVAAGSIGSVTGGAARSASLLAGAGAASAGMAGAGVRGMNDPSDLGSTARPEGGGMTAGYELDRLLRSPTAAGTSTTAGGPATDAAGGSNPGEVRAEALHLAMNAAITGNMTEEDRNHLASLVAAKARITQDEAQRRVDTFIADAKDAQSRLKAAADAARKAASETAIFTSLAMLIGAFIASVAAAIGGRLRDEHR